MGLSFRIQKVVGDGCLTEIRRMVLEKSLFYHYIRKGRSLVDLFFKSKLTDCTLLRLSLKCFSSALAFHIKNNSRLKASKKKKIRCCQIYVLEKEIPPCDIKSFLLKLRKGLINHLTQEKSSHISPLSASVVTKVIFENPAIPEYPSFI